MRSSMDMILRLCFKAKRCNSFPRAIEPSSAIISHITPLGLSPANNDKSILASV